MQDELFDRSYQDGREDLHASVDRLLVRIGQGVRTTFDAIHRVEWSAPWKREAERNRTGLA